MRILVAGALGEVGRSVSNSLESGGHQVVPVSSRAPRPGANALSLVQGCELIRNRQVDLVVVASSQGDHREAATSGINTCELLAPVVCESGLPSVLLSTLRVLEGYAHSIHEDAPAHPTSDYARANANNEKLWLQESGPRGSVLRVANYFCAPQAVDSPQTRLLPWSLVTDALVVDSITVKSGPGTSREFVSDTDVARAIQVLAAETPEARICASLPGYPTNLENLVSLVQRACSEVGRSAPDSRFGVDNSTPTPVTASWLESQGWESTLSDKEIVQTIVDWVRKNYPEVT